MTWMLAEAQIAVTTKSKNLRVSKGMHTVPSGRGDGFSTTVANLLMRCALPASEVEVEWSLATSSSYNGLNFFR